MLAAIAPMVVAFDRACGVEHRGGKDSVRKVDELKISPAGRYLLPSWTKARRRH
jgi:hypothetical protein